jgi:hypothetical protein
VITVKRYQRLGSLKDLLHGVVPTANFHVGIFCLGLKIEITQIFLGKIFLSK